MPAPRLVATMAEDFAGVLLDVGEAQRAALIWGAAESARTRYGVSMGDDQLAETAETIAEGRSQLGSEWDALVEQGRSLDLEELLLTTIGARADGVDKTLCARVDRTPEPRSRHGR